MAIKLAGYDIGTAAVVDDQDETRQTMCDELKLADLDVDPLVGPFGNVNDLLMSICKRSQAAVCDHRLYNFATCQGADVVSRLYKRGFPAVLVTTYSNADLDLFRPFRRWIPVLLPADKTTDGDTLIHGWETCLREFQDDFTPTRRPWKTLVRIVDVDREQRPPMVYAVVPGWDSSSKVRFPITVIPPELQSKVCAGERFFAQVNKGAESAAELYFSDFTYPG